MIFLLFLSLCIIIILSALLMTMMNNGSQKSITNDNKKIKNELKNTVSNTPMDFETDFDKNIVPIINIHVTDFIMYKYRPHIYSPKYKYVTADGFWREESSEHIKNVMSAIPKQMVEYFNRYMDDESFFLKVAQLTKDLTIQEMAKELAVYNEEKKIPVEQIQV